MASGPRPQSQGPGASLFQKTKLVRVESLEKELVMWVLGIAICPHKSALRHSPLLCAQEAGWDGSLTSGFRLDPASAGHVRREVGGREVHWEGLTPLAPFLLLPWLAASSDSRLQLVFAA